MSMDSINIAQNVKPILNDLRKKLNLGTYSQTIEFLLNKYNATSVVHRKPSIRSQVLHLMNDGNTWQLADLVAEVSKNVKQDSNTIKRFIESILETAPEITKAGDARYKII